MQVINMKVKMLGSFSVWVNGQSIVSGAKKLTKPWQLFCYLVLHRDKFVTTQQLITLLWPNGTLAESTNVLKNVVYSLRKELCGGESLTDSPIIYFTGGYRFDPAVDLELDVDVFSKLCDNANDLPKEKRFSSYEKAVKAYTGSFLPQLDQDLWVVPKALEYKQKYSQCVHGLCDLLWKEEKYKELLDVVSKAVEFDLLDEISTVYLFRAMWELKMYRVIVTTYSRMSQQYKNIFDGGFPQKIQDIYSDASEKINKVEQDIILIKTELTNDEQTARPQRGAYFCSYPNLRGSYGLLKRAVDRSEQVLMLALFTLSIPSPDEMDGYDLVRAMAEFKIVAMNTLRKTDAIARYSHNQYVMLISVTSLEDGRLVRDKIKKNYAKAISYKKVNIDVKLAEV